MADVFAEDILNPPARPPDPTRAPTVYADDIDPRFASPVPDQPAPDVTGDMTWDERFWAGMGSWFTDKALGANQRLASARLAISNVTGEDRDRLQGVVAGLEAEAKEKKRIDAALLRTGWAKAGVAGGNIAASLVLPLRLTGALAYGAIEGAADPLTEEENTGKGVLAQSGKGAALAGAGYLGGKAVLEGGSRAYSALRGIRPNIPIAERLAAGQRNDVTLSLGDLTQNTGVMKAENAIETIPFSGRAKQVETQSKQVLDMVNRMVDTAKPALLQKPDEAMVAAMSGKEIRAHLPPGSNARNLTDQALSALPYSALEHAGIRAEHESANDAMAALVKEGYAREKSAARSAYDAVSQLAQKTKAPPVELTNLRAAAGDALDKYPEFFGSLQNQKVVRTLEDVIESTSPRPSAIVDTAGRPLSTQPSALGFDQARDLRSILGSLSRQAERQIQAGTASDPKAAGALMNLYRAVTNDLERWGTQDADPAVGAAYRLANQTYREGVVRFRESPALKQVIRRDFDTDRTFQTLIKPGAKNVAEDALFAMGPRGRQVMQYALLEDLAGAGSKPAVDVARAAQLGAPETSALTQEFSPKAFVERARALRDPLSVALNDDAQYVSFLRDLDLVSATRHSAAEAAREPMEGTRLLPYAVMKASSGAATPFAWAAHRLLSNPATRRLAATRSLIEETTPDWLRAAVRGVPRAAAVGFGETED